ncbi:Prolyl 3-hydroxylase ogfod1 [Clydaea vesicula]|uniref:Prolyl 3-hydroxylase ogfod1 n=1 Tax=Clydaea vesicula TaxID=447962 RepID=A0AAD5XV92_9FUNG|nr:Prolyl 3-hydroxylase ogfod1 [Clydaea vesicula]
MNLKRTGSISLTTDDSKKQKSNSNVLLINKVFFTSKFNKYFNEKWNFPSMNEDSPSTDNLIINSQSNFVSTYPFKFAVFTDFLDANFISKLKIELENETFFHKSNDLYEFYQSEDLKLTKQENLKMYPTAGYLLCHDDDVQDWKSSDSEVTYSRRIAFIIYLTEKDWTAENGGLLQLFDELNGQPNKVVTSIVPKYNSFAFFEVLPTSYHQVQEVFRKNERISISGWLHGPRPDSVTPFLNKSIREKVIDISFDGNESLENKEILLSDFINPVYLTEESIQTIQEKFLETSSIELTLFFKKEKFEILKNIVFDEKLKSNFELIGPPSLQNYKTLKFIKDLEVINLMKFLRSSTFTSYIETLTSVNIKKQQIKNVEIRKFSSSCYTLMHDQAYETGNRLDIYFHFNSQNERINGGGEVF